MWWEYKIVYFDPDCDISYIEFELNTLGQIGWEVCGQSQNTRGSIIYTLKSQVVREAQDCLDDIEGHP
jgi:uncharacterized protein YuzE